MSTIQFATTIKNGFISISDYELQVNVIGSKDGYLVEDRCTGMVLARNVSQRVAHRHATLYRQTHR